MIVVGASAGGVQALQGLVAQLPPELPASMVVVLHLMSAGTSVLRNILDRAGPRENGHRPAIEPLVRATVEKVTERRVETCLSQINKDGVAAEVFVLDPHIRAEAE